jgi:negative regulator of sigma E activity
MSAASKRSGAAELRSSILAKNTFLRVPRWRQARPQMALAASLFLAGLAGLRPIRSFADYKR